MLFMRGLRLQFNVYPNFRNMGNSIRDFFLLFEENNTKTSNAFPEMYDIMIFFRCVRDLRNFIAMVS